MPFLAKLDLGGVSDARRARRLFAHRLDALLIGHDRRFSVIIHNMSETGFLAEFSSELQIGDEVRLHVARQGYVAARVVWKRGLGHGCEFLEPLPFEVVQETIAASMRFGEESGIAAAERESRVAELSGHRRRVWRERLGALVMLACLLVAVAVLAAVLVGVVTD